MRGNQSLAQPTPSFPSGPVWSSVPEGARKKTVSFSNPLWAPDARVDGEAQASGLVILSHPSWVVGPRLWG